jgi:formylglycine-generating enzyme required for sulfatase activity
MAYSHWLGGSLPTEAQFEYALRRTASTFSGNNAGGVSTGTYPYGNGTSDYGDYAWYSVNGMGDDADGTTSVDDYGYASTHAHRVGQKLPSPIGLYDMSGNMFEWVADWYAVYGTTAANYWSSANNGAVAMSIYLDPIYKTSASYRVLRGSSWNFAESALPPSNRYTLTPATCNAGHGFRPCWNLTALPSLQ